MSVFEDRGPLVMTVRQVVQAHRSSGDTAPAMTKGTQLERVRTLLGRVSKYPVVRSNPIAQCCVQ